MRTLSPATRVANLVAVAAAICAPAVASATTPASGYLYQREIVGELTEGCVAQAPGGLYVGVGPALSFPPAGGTRSILFVADGGATSTVATGLNAIGDCLYDADADVLYVTDSGYEYTGATTGDTVFAIPGGSAGAPVDLFAVLPAGSIPYAFSIEKLGTSLLVSDAAGGGSGTVVEIDLSGVTPSASTFASGFDYTGGVVVDGGRVFIAEALEPFFDAAIYEYTTAGAYSSTLSGPTYDHGSVDLAVAADGNLLVTGLPTIASVDGGGAATALVSGLDGGTGFDAYGGGVATNAFTGRIDFLASSFTGADDDSSVHRLVPIDRLVPGGGSAKTDCVMELYGLELIAPSPGRKARTAICVDGAPCDADGVADGTCTFPIGICINAADARLADCEPSAVASIELRKAKPESDELAALVDAAAAAMPSADPTCFFGDGYQVPVRTSLSGSTRAGKGRIKLKAVSDDERPRKDNDVARLVCEPAP